jgi:hypothetical protein
MENTMTELQNFTNTLSETDMHTIFEGFLKAVSDADARNKIAEHLDITDDELFRIINLLANYMGGNTNE